MRNVAALAVFMRFNDESWWWLTFWGTLYMYVIDGSWTQSLPIPSIGHRAGSGNSHSIAGM